MVWAGWGVVVCIFKRSFYLPIRTQHNSMAYKTDRQIKVIRILNISLGR